MEECSADDNPRTLEGCFVDDVARTSERKLEDEGLNVNDAARICNDRTRKKLRKFQLSEIPLVTLLKSFSRGKTQGKSKTRTKGLLSSITSSKLPSKVHSTF